MQGDDLKTISLFSFLFSPFFIPTVFLCLHLSFLFFHLHLSRFSYHTPSSSTFTCRALSSEIWRYVVQRIPTDVLEESVASIFRVENWIHVPLKRRLIFTGLQGVTSQKIEIFTTSAVRTSNTTFTIPRLSSSFPSYYFLHSFPTSSVFGMLFFLFFTSWLSQGWQQPIPAVQRGPQTRALLSMKRRLAVYLRSARGIDCSARFALFCWKYHSLTCSALETHFSNILLSARWFSLPHVMLYKTS